jgi:glycosyltransferase involved in cell wall biosynthesis
VDWVGHEAVPAYLNLADLVLMPSAAEAQALAYLEAQACARTLLASDIPAAREVVSDGKNGILFPSGDAGRLAEETLRAARDDRLRAAIGRASRESVRAHAVPRAVDAYERIIRGLAASPASPGPSPRGGPPAGPLACGTG